MSVVPAHEATATFDCRVAGCARPAKTNRGVYAYLCDEHATAKGQGRIRANGDNARTTVPPPGSFETAAKSLVALGRKADRAREQMRPAVERAKEAKTRADDARAEFLNAVRALLEEQRA